MLRPTIDSLKNVRVRVLGVVLTGVREKYKPFSRYSGGYSYYSNRKYSYKYYEYYSAGSRHGRGKKKGSSQSGSEHGHGSSKVAERQPRNTGIDVDAIIGDDKK